MLFHGHLKVDILHGAPKEHRIFYRDTAALASSGKPKKPLAPE